MDFDGKRAVVSGGTQGVGEAVVARLRAGGARVVAAARTRPEPVPEGFVQADVSTADGVESLAAAALDHLGGGVDILVNVVGGSSAPPGGVLALTDEHWRVDIDRNLMSAVRRRHPAGPAGDA